MRCFRIISHKSSLVCSSLLGLIVWVAEPLANDLSTISSDLTQASSKIHNLHIVILWICAVAAVAVFAAMIYSIFTHRKSQDEAAGNFHKRSSTEFIWTVIPFAIVVLMAIPAAKTLLYRETAQLSEMRLRITGENCNWRYDYLDHDFSVSIDLDTGSSAAAGVEDVSDLLGNDRSVVLPIQKTIHLMFTSIDRVYTWSVPDLKVKQDATPARLSDQRIEIEAPGTYRGDPIDSCADEQGSAPIIVVATTELEYKKWVNRQHAARASVDHIDRR